MLPALSLVLAGCAGEQAPVVNQAAETSKQSFLEAMSVMCNVDSLAGLSATDDALFEIGQKRSAYIADHVENPDGIEFRTIVSVKTPEEQAILIREQAKILGVEHCPLADAIQASPAGGLAP